jgi:hypothetical protein
MTPNPPVVRREVMQLQSPKRRFHLGDPATWWRDLSYVHSAAREGFTVVLKLT